MSYVPLSDEEKRVIFSQTFMRTLHGLDKTEQVRVLKRLLAMLTSSAPQRYIYETVTNCEELQVIRVGGDLRIFCRLVMGVPHEEKTYNILTVFDVDKHNYRQHELQRVDEHAVARLETITDFSTVEDVTAWLEAKNAKDAEFLSKELDRL